MEKIQSILVICDGFPNKNCPYRYTFLEQIVTGFANQGIQVSVICPILNTQKKLYETAEWEYPVKNGMLVHVYQPVIQNYSMRQIAGIKLGKLTYASFKRAVLSTVSKHGIKPQVIYSHFLFPSGCVAAELGNIMGIKSFCACGESSIDSYLAPVGEEFVKKHINGLCGIVSVSSVNESVIRTKRLVRNCRVTVIPNGVDHKIFYQRDKKNCRNKLGLSLTDYVGIYVGGFNENKGYKRVAEAASQVENLKMMYVGGSEETRIEGVTAFVGKVPHSEIPDYLSAADFFILPTRAEGCCNAIIEAMACGLPVISSDLPFNYDVLDSETAILVDPNNIDELKNAMESLKDDRVRELKANRAVERASHFRVDERAAKIIDFISESVKN